VQGLLAEVHRRRFAQAAGRHPCSCDVPASEVFRFHGTEVAEYAGGIAMHSLRAASSGYAEQARGWNLLGPVKLYFFGAGPKGVHACEHFDHIRCCWESTPLPPTAEHESIHALTRAIAVGRRVYVLVQLHDHELESEAEEDLDGEETEQGWESWCWYSFTAGCADWKKLPPMLEEHACPGAQAIALAGRLYMCGGERATERFDPQRWAWEVISPMSVARYEAAAAALAGQLYMCGGQEEDRHHESVERLHPATGEWEELPPMSARRKDIAAASVAGRLYVCGNLPHLVISSQNDLFAECFDPASSTWETLPPMPALFWGTVTRIIPASWQAISLAGQLFLFGEWNAGGVFFDPSEGIWQALPPLRPLDVIDDSFTSWHATPHAGQLCVFGDALIGPGDDSPDTEWHSFDLLSRASQALPRVPLRMRSRRLIAVTLANEL